MADHDTRMYENVLEMLSSEENPTPMVRLNRTVPFTQARVYGKLEWYNPFGAVKDRVAANMIRDANDKGLLADGQKLVEPTSGNTGMGLAMVANAKGYSLSTPLSKQIPAEKRVMLRFFGSNVEELDDTLCPAPWAPEGAIARALELADQPDFHMLNQYENEANLEAHIRTTGPEIWRQTGGKVTHFVASLGTCGTITGNGRFLKGKNPDIQVIAVHPEEGHDIPGVRSLRQLKQTKLFHPEEYDHIVGVSNEEAYAMCLRLNREESLIAGPSAAMALVGALRVVEDQPDAVIVVMFPDNVFKYASSFEKHFPRFRAARAPGEGSGEPSPKEQLMTTLVENSRNAHNTCEIDDLHAILEGAGEPPLLVDVRGADTYASKHIAGAVNIPLGEMGDRQAELPIDRDAPIVTVCNRGNMSISGMLFLQSLGYRRVTSLNGGTVGWADKDYPVE
ncbi:MAG: pyridoxal-phosphate dependent enzyme [Myxococcota bacterium]|jgi:cysteine synthase/rhodanese-related sulfurtransferase|nr:pyridoxal-phosphate dependent enzyme [Myxococcota bacterium]